MAVQTLDARGLKCPQPTLKITAMAVRMKPGDVLEAIADCSTFEKDVRDWCMRSVNKKGTGYFLRVPFSTLMGFIC